MKRLRVRAVVMTRWMCRVLLSALLLAAAPGVFLAQQVPHPPDRPDAKQPPAQPPQPRSSQSGESATTFKVNVKIGRAHV